MMGIIIAAAVISLIGMLIGVALVYIGKKFYVEVDERETAIRKALPGNNCGACGYAGCDALAAAITKREAPVNGCPVGGATAAERIGSIMGIAAESAERKTAFVHCAGTNDAALQKANYVGIRDCRSAALSGIITKRCAYGCLGFGSCAAVCPQNAISIVNGVAKVDEDKCVSCGLCVKQCPNGLIELMPEKAKIRVKCCSHDKGSEVRKNCSAGCIGCGMCERSCKFDAVHVKNGLAYIDPDKCKKCGICAAKCPTGAILDMVH